MPPENETIQDEAEDEAEDEPEEEKPILFELQIPPPEDIGTGKGRLVPWWSRKIQYKIRNWANDRQQRERRAREEECSEDS